MLRNQLNIIDILLLSYTAITGFYFCLTSKNEFNFFEITQWSAFFLCYCIARKISQKQWCLWGIVLLGIIEATIAICQKAHWIDSFHSTFNMTGTFTNPGPLGGFLAIAMTIIFGFYLEYQEHSWTKLLLLFIIVLLLAIIILTDSRASWLAALFGTGYLIFLKKKEHGNSLSNISKVGIIIFVLLFSAFAYYYKKNSANGRLLIWRVSSEMLADAPLMGKGIGNFKKEYMHYQARYFKSHPHSSYATLADNTTYPYNEFLLIGVEQGMVGLIFILCIIVSALKYASYQNYHKIYPSSFITLLIFSLFSYPSNVVLLWLLVPLLLGGIQCKKSRSISTSYKFQLVEWFVYICFLTQFFWGSYRYYELKNNVKKLYSLSPQESKKAKIYLEKSRTELQSTPRLLDVYAQYYYQNFPPSVSLSVLKQATSIIPSSELYCHLGDSYKKLNQMDEAVVCYTLASEMVPNRIQPKYKLFCLYRDRKDTIQMKKAAFEALHIKVKVMNTKTLRMRGEIKSSLKLTDIN
ncbi:O-antigen ligase [Bacteroides sp. GM023]|uniref:O-antigen ligase family protein n=1 Tax=Bacteroides sp. GM023 TaxID=2723058 RepID=UPI00168BB32C|nr:O-antigen ligase family protein [Bacteroides sp. GM023]MBD3588845.1 hypothetical protein [Bacteroides sp. GM023]